MQKQVCNVMTSHVGSDYNVQLLIGSITLNIIYSSKI